jgi:hypothetical protein
MKKYQDRMMPDEKNCSGPAKMNEILQNVYL